ncbi:titin isoform X2 [Manduca sexta]|uniref:titin isoform X2 n=1 Tax=Manduca sexta TaxID=7130 RepID=UPI00188FA788|nr:titin isoform X2 [Manduca sexta]
MAMALELIEPPLLEGDERRHEALTVIQHLEDTLAMTGDNVLFECRIAAPYSANCVWYKDGYIIRNRPRYRCVRHKNWYRLEIETAQATDQGVFSLICTNDISQTLTTAMLFVPTARLNEVAYYSVNPYDCTRIVRHLSPVIINVGEKIELLLHSETYVHIKHNWFKDNVEITGNERIHIENNNSVANLVIEMAELCDAGIYTLVMSTSEGIISSYAAVHVLEDIDKYTITIPTITEHLKRDLEVMENQYVKLMSRGIYDLQTKVQWYMNDVLLEDSLVLQQDYGNGYVALKIFDTSPELTGKYRVVMRHEQTEKIDVSVCNLSIRRSLLTKPINTDVVDPLESAVACCGSRVVFKCTFSCDNHKNMKVIWFVGRYKVERSNRMFSVFHKGGTFMLHIKRMHISMAGEVICEVHEWRHSPKYTHVAQSTANLTMVPQGYLKETKGDRASRVFIEGSHLRLSYPEEGNFQQDDTPGSSGEQASSSGNGQAPGTSTAPPQQQHRPQEICRAVPIKFQFCKLDEDGQYYFCWNPRDGQRIYYNQQSKMTLRKRRDVGVFEWVNPEAAGAWYCVSFQTEDGAFKELGITETPILEIEGPPLETLLIFNIAPILPVRSVHRPLTCFRLDTEMELSIPPERRVRLYEKFETWYTKRNELIGGGAFGKVALIEDDYGESFAAKVIRVQDKNKIGYVLREFFTLRKLVNHNVVGVVDAYTATQFVVIVMDYLWGGELLDRIVRDKHINEADLPPVVKQICNGLAFIHSQNIVHLDLKPENLVFAHPNSLVVKLVDFGLSRVLHEGSKIKAVYGTREYVAPEILTFEPVNLNSDMWSLGVIVYMILSGSLPFNGDTEAELTSKVISAQYHYENPAFRTVSDLVKDFIDHLLVVNPRRRFKAENALKHPWIVYGPPKGSTTGALKIARAKLKVYMRIRQMKWQEKARYFRYFWTF